MNYIYHMVPKKMIGEELFPLNQLKTRQEELYIAYAKKYNDHPARAKLLERRIPKLNCLWNDVIHFLPLHPSLVYDALNKIGVNVNSDRKFYKIPITNLQHNKNAIYIYNKDNYQGPDVEMKNDTIHLLDINKYEELSTVPSDAIAYYEEQHSKGNRFGMFQFIPHIFSLGKVNVSNAEIIRWGDKIN
ncbi:group-specific protein [Halalkalibacter urbisdiaboli]|uniref:group-specific protein n=1 Tax=Halalkalibacter urbisdiaboli TaxID=1960589 RepID=UPI000B44416C|nr:group-specific protein [Halalkalibacter urbisdiaboli]